MARMIDVDDDDTDDDYTMEATFETECPDGCGYLIEPGDLITPTDWGWVLFTHPED